MSEVTASSIEDVRLGTQMVSALMVGTNEMYVRFSHHRYATAGNFSFTLPDWATGYGVFMSGGGGGGRCGDGGNGAQGYGGRGGDIVGVAVIMGDDIPNRVVSGTIGAGGAGGKGGSSGVFGQNGGNTTIITHTSKMYTAAGGTGNPTSGMTAGGISTQVFSEPFPKYFNMPPDTRFTNGPGGTGNAGAGKRGGGGAGGNGGRFGSYTHGGKGGDGFVEIYVWGMPRHWTSLPPRETERITLGTDLEARDQLRAALTARGLGHQTVTEIPFDIELVGTGSARDMFRACSALTSVPDMDTSGVTNMRSMFNGCSSLTSVPDMDTSQVTHMGWMFQDCSSLTSLPDMDTSNVTNMDSMFRACSSLTDGNVRLIGRHPQVSTTDMIANSGLTKEPFYNVVKITLGTNLEARDQLRAALTDRGLDYTTVTEIPFDIEFIGSGSAQNMFDGCSSLTSVPDMDTSGVTNMAYMFANCSSLTSVPEMDTVQVWDVSFMFYNCAALTDGNVRLIGRHPQVNTTDMIDGSGLTLEPFIDVVQITLDNEGLSHWMFRAELSDRGLDYQTVEELPFEIELVGTGSTQYMFEGCSSLTSVPDMDTSQVTNMTSMFNGCSSLTSVSDMDTSQVTDMRWMFLNCSALTDGNVRLIGRHPNVTTTGMITGSGLTREPWDIVPPRTVTIKTDSVGEWEKNTVTGDITLIQGVVSGNIVRFVADVTCDKYSYSSDSYMTQEPGTVLRAGADIKPYKIGTYVFTEVL